MTGLSLRVNTAVQQVIGTEAGGMARDPAWRSSNGSADVSAMASTGVPMSSERFAESAPGATYCGRAAASR